MLGVVGDPDRPLDRAALSESCAVVAEQAVVLGEAGLSQERLGPGDPPPQWISTTGSPDPRSSYVRERSFTGARPASVVAVPSLRAITSYIQ
jgi:hypothetical protein